MTEFELHIAARLTSVEYLLRVILQSRLMERPDPLGEAQKVRRAMVDRTRFAATNPEGGDPDTGMRVQAAAADALERWFDLLEAEIRARLG